MSERYDPEQDPEDGQFGDDDEDGDPEQQPGCRHPIDADEDEWRDEQYGRLKDTRRLVAEGLVDINFHETLADLQGLAAKALLLANANFDFLIRLGDPEQGEKQIKNAIGLAGCYKSLIKARDELLDGIGRRR